MRIDIPRLGLGGAPLGNMFKQVDDDTAQAVLDSSWAAGFRLYDTSPHYGAGLSEERFGRFLTGKPRDQYMLSTKVGRLLQPSNTAENAPPFVAERPAKRVVDYSADGTRRSLLDSLQRLGLDRVDLVYIHDVSEDQWGPKWREYFDQAMAGAAQALTRLREEGVIKGWGLGVNLVEPCRLALEMADPDVFLLAGRYSLLDHEEALKTLFPQCQERGVGIVVGGPFNSGLLAGGSHFDYAPASEAVQRRKHLIDACCLEHGVDTGAAALQFCLAHPAVISAIPGTANPARPAQYAAQLTAEIPASLWASLLGAGVLAEGAPVPG